MMKKRKNVEKQNGITLVALVITIVVMLILAGVTINLTLGENGIFTTARQAAKNYTDAQEKELAYLEGFTNQVNNIVNPAPLGTIIRTENGVNYIADGAGNTIPVPVGFSPIATPDQGTKDTGFVIKNDIDGNEFVWVPVEKYERIAWARDGWEKSQGTNGIDISTNSIKITRADLDIEISYWIEAMPNDENTSVSTYGGFYIGRYETGIKNGTLSENVTEGTKWTGENIELVVQEKQQVWNHITRDRAVLEAKSLYNKTDNNVISKLCSSYAWDSTLKFIGKNNSQFLTNSTGGNYKIETGALQETGYHKINNIYDMAGNVWEWTTEKSNYSTDWYCHRGGVYSHDAFGSPIASRASSSSSSTEKFIGLRITLFL